MPEDLRDRGDVTVPVEAFSRRAFVGERAEAAKRQAARIAGSLLTRMRRATDGGASGPVRGGLGVRAARFTALGGGG